MSVFSPPANRKTSQNETAAGMEIHPCRMSPTAAAPAAPRKKHPNVHKSFKYMRECIHTQTHIHTRVAYQVHPYIRACPRPILSSSHLVLGRPRNRLQDHVTALRRQARPPVHGLDDVRPSRSYLSYLYHLASATKRGGGY